VNFGLMMFAFFKLAGHHKSRSVEVEPLELLDALEVSREGDLADRSLAFRSLRAPKVSGSFSNGRSVANMINYGMADGVGLVGPLYIDNLGWRAQSVDLGLFVNRMESYHRPMHGDAGTPGFQVDGVAAVKRIT
jgi:hypothetical protein